MLRSVANRRASVFRGSPWPTRLFGEIPTRCSDGMALTATQSKPRVLVVDHLHTVDTATVLLEFHGAKVDGACDGRTAIELARASCPDIAFVDLGIPATDGCEVARALQQLRAPKTPVLVAVSDFGHPFDKMRCAEAGFDLHLWKPIDFVAVFEHLRLLLHGPTLERARKLARANRTASRDLLLAQVQMAATFLRIAQTTRNATTRQRCLAKAKRGRDDVAYHLQRTPWTIVRSPLDFVLEESLGKALGLLNTTMGTIQLLNGEGVLRIAVQRGFDAEFLKRFPVMGAGDASACYTALSENATVAIEDVNADVRFEVHRIASLVKFRAMSSTPITTGETPPLGILSVHFSRSHRFARWELDGLERCAREAATMIHWAAH